MKRTVVSRTLSDVQERLEEACRLLEHADEHSVVAAGRRFQEASALLNSRPRGEHATAAEAMLLRRASARAGKLLEALDGWQIKLASLVSGDDTAAPGYAADGRTTGAGGRGSVGVVG